MQTQINQNTKHFRFRMKEAGFRITGHDDVAIAPVWLGDAKLARYCLISMYWYKRNNLVHLQKKC